jgi:hypothetical protein
MSPLKLKTLREARPFRPFAIRLADGRALRIPHREFLAVSPNERLAVVFDEDGSPEAVELLMITSLRPLADRRPRRRPRRRAG